MIGRVVSTKMKNTAVVLVTSTKTHPLYRKAFTRNKKFLAQDNVGVKMGDIVEFIKVRPISKNKHWQIERKVGRSIEEIVGEQLKEQAEEVISEVMPEGQNVGESVDQNISEENKEKGGKQVEAVVDDLAESAKKTPKRRAKSVQ